MTTKGLKFSSGHKKKISDALKGVPKSVSHRRNAAKARRGFKHTLETKRKISETKKGKSLSPKVRRRVAAANRRRLLGKHLPKLHRKRISEALKGNTNTLGHIPSKSQRIKVSKALSGISLTKSHRKKLSEAQKIRAKNEPKEVKARRARKQSRTWYSRSEEERAKLVAKRAKAQQAGRVHKATTSSGTKIKVHSGWEAIVYDILENLGVVFTYANDPNSNLMLKLPTRCWTPDFRIHGKGGLLVEVKGLDWNGNFFGKILPDFKRSKYAKRFSLLLVDKSLIKSRNKITSWKRFLEYGHFIHVASKSKHKWSEKEIKKK